MFADFWVDNPKISFLMKSSSESNIGDSGFIEKTLEILVGKSKLN